jgi:adenosylmethionine-8-amino-7-oxononanoate aminotransferase
MDLVAQPFDRPDRIWHPYTRVSSYRERPLPVMVRGRGIYLYDAAGRPYLDAVSSWWACSLGHGHPRLIAAIERQARRLQHCILGNQSHPAALHLAEQLSDLAGGERHVHFASDGASAVEAALKIAVQYHHNLGHPGRTAFLSLTEPYHGDTLGAVSVGYMEAFHRAFRPLLFRCHTVPTPSCAGCRADPGGQSCSAPCFESTLEVLRAHGDELAAVIVEPLCQGAAGMRMYGGGYLGRLADACRDLGILLIVDEVAMGFGRTGAMFAHQHPGIDPDILCVGKALSAGTLPISAAIVKDAIFQTFTDQPDDHTFYHGHTFAGNPIAAAAALETLAIYRDEHILDRVREAAPILREALEPLRTLPCVRDVRCLGLIGAVELDPDPTPAGIPLPEHLRLALLEQGILLRPLGNVAYLMPPLITPHQALQDLAHAMHRTLETLCR